MLTSQSKYVEYCSWDVSLVVTLLVTSDIHGHEPNYIGQKVDRSTLTPPFLGWSPLPSCFQFSHFGQKAGGISDPAPPCRRAQAREGQISFSQQEQHVFSTRLHSVHRRGTACPMAALLNIETPVRYASTVAKRSHAVNVHGTRVLSLVLKQSDHARVAAADQIPRTGKDQGGKVSGRDDLGQAASTRSFRACAIGVDDQEGCTQAQEGQQTGREHKPSTWLNTWIHFPEQHRISNKKNNDASHG